MTEAQQDGPGESTWEIVIGLEVHAQIISQSKLFSDASTAFGAAPNSQVSLVDAAMPGMLPVVNQECLRQAVKTGLGLNAKVNLYSVFDRKNYFYPDLPQGYQISQYAHPIVGEGALTLTLADGAEKRVRIERLHLEQDAGKSIHDMEATRTCIDLNRSGIGLMEIVSHPDMRTAEEAGAYVKKLRSILRYLGTCDGNMQEGSLRCDVNVSVRRPGAALGVRCEIKNVNSIRFVRQAVDFEAARQIAILEDGGAIEQETRLFDPDRGETRPMRTKEDAHDYRYFPDPDLPPVQLTAAYVDQIAADLPELPDAKEARLIKDYGLGAEEAGLLVEERETAAYYENLCAGRDPKLAANWLLTELFGALNKAGVSLAASPVTPEMLGGLLDLLAEDVISGRIAKDVFAEMFATGSAAAEIVEAKGLRQVSDTGALADLIAAVLAENPDKVAEYKAGKDKLFGFFVGQAMKRSAGKANPQIVNQLLREALDS